MKYVGKSATGGSVYRKSVAERDGQFYVEFGDGTERGPFSSEEEAMAVHRQDDVSAKRVSKGQSDVEINSRNFGAFKSEVQARGGRVTTFRDRGEGPRATILATVGGLDEDDLNELQGKYSVNR